MTKFFIVALICLLTFLTACSSNGTMVKGVSSGFFSKCSDCKLKKYQHKEAIYKIRSDAALLMCQTQSKNHNSQQMLVTIPCSAFAGGCRINSSPMVVNHPEAKPFDMIGCVATMVQHPWERIIGKGFDTVQFIAKLGIPAVAAVKIADHLASRQNSDSASTFNVNNNAADSNVGVISNSSETSVNIDKQKNSEGDISDQTTESNDNDLVDADSESQEEDE